MSTNIPKDDGQAGTHPDSHNTPSTGQDAWNTAKAGEAHAGASDGGIGAPGGTVEGGASGAIGVGIGQGGGAVDGGIGGGVGRGAEGGAGGGIGQGASQHLAQPTTHQDFSHMLDHMGDIHLPGTEAPQHTGAQDHKDGLHQTDAQLAQPSGGHVDAHALDNIGDINLTEQDMAGGHPGASHGQGEPAAAEQPDRSLEIINHEPAHVVQPASDAGQHLAEGATADGLLAGVGHKVQHAAEVVKAHAPEIAHAAGTAIGVVLGHHHGPGQSNLEAGSSPAPSVSVTVSNADADTHAGAVITAQAADDPAPSQAEHDAQVQAEAEAQADAHAQAEAHEAIEADDSDGAEVIDASSDHDDDDDAGASGHHVHHHDGYADHHHADH